MTTKTRDSASANPELARDTVRPGYWSRLVRILVSVALMALVLSQVNVQGAFSAVAAADLRFLALALVLNFVGAALTATRWRVLLAAHAVTVGTPFLVARWMEACFFNQFLPSTIGGDAKRIYDSWKLGAGKAAAVATIGVDRLLGLLALMIFGVAAVFLSTTDVGGRETLVIFVVCCLFALAAAAVVVFFPPNWVVALMRAIRSRLPGFAGRIADKLSAPFEAYRGKGRILTVGLILSAVLQFNVILFYFLIGRSLGIELDVVDYMLIIPIANVILLLPITVNGIGLREGVFALLLGSFGVAGAVSVAFAWASFGLFVVFGLLGGIVYATQGERPRRIS